MFFRLGLATMMAGKNTVKLTHRIVMISSQRLLYSQNHFVLHRNFFLASTHHSIPYLIRLEYIEELTAPAFFAVLPHNDKKAVRQAVATCL